MPPRRNRTSDSTPKAETSKIPKLATEKKFLPEDHARATEITDRKKIKHEEEVKAEFRVRAI